MWQLQKDAAQPGFLSQHPIVVQEQVHAQAPCHEGDAQLAHFKGRSCYTRSREPTAELQHEKLLETGDLSSAQEGVKSNPFVPQWCNVPSQVPG